MKLKTNQAKHKDQPELVTPNGIRLSITPPINEGYWLYKVKVAKGQAIVGFRKFGTIGIGFQHEEDWNTNLPYTTDAEEIYDHIKHNKACKASRKKCVKAIRMVQAAADREMNQ